MASDGKVVIRTDLDNSSIPKGIKNVKGELGGLVKVVGSVSAAIVAAFAGAAALLTKQAVDAYADYEQLTGGVETLFKDSARKVTKYAENAFYTVGISANEYMETVTSFSASLISALGGDTEKAADIADMALTDMADNANKMGTPLENIKSAYQGFAKQQYQLLDNLKLGYGGTKTEMERLLKDAENLTGVKYDISNLADVYNAIHAIQIKLGIAGTTAKEAEKTISGSASMVEAAWKNVLTSIGGGGDIDKAINNLVFSVSKYFENIVPVVERALSGIGQLIEKIAPMLVQTVATALIKAIPSLINAVYQMIVGLAKGIYQGIFALFFGEEMSVEKQLHDVGGNASQELASNYADAADSAEAVADSAKETKRTLAGFDELNVLNNKKDSVPLIEAELSSSDTSVGNINIGGDVHDNLSPVVQKAIDKVMRLLDPLRNIDLSPLMSSFKNLGESIWDFGGIVCDALEWAWFNILAPLAEWTIEEAAPASVDLLSSAFDLLSAVLEPVLDGVKILWEHLEPIVKWIEDTAIFALGEFEKQFDKLAVVFEEKGPEIEEIFKNLGVVVDAMWVILEPILNDLRDLWAKVLDYFGDKAVLDIQSAIDALSGFSEFLAGVFTGDFKSAFNGIIDVLNAFISKTLGKINLAIDGINALSFDIPDWVPVIGGNSFGPNLPKITIPQIPKLAQGAVIPPNREFMAILGDQKHGTNIEAPLATIQEAVAAVMADYEAANLAGHEATVEMLREILTAVLCIEVGDSTIGQAANRYNQKMAIIKGGL